MKIVGVRLDEPGYVFSESTKKKHQESKKVLMNPLVRNTSYKFIVTWKCTRSLVFLFVFTVYRAATFFLYRNSVEEHH